MPFCSQCGNQVGGRDAYCGRCGARQPMGPALAADPLSQISPRTASICCYIPGVGWIASIIVLASQKFRKDRVVRFHAFQGLYLFVAWLLDSWVLRPMSEMIPHVPIHGLVEALLLGLSIFMIVKAAHGEAYSLPVFGELAQRSIAED
jgi:uncharacterized membrane protein